MRLFKKKKEHDWSKYQLFFDPEESKTVHCNEISKEVHTRKRHYVRIDCYSCIDYREKVAIPVCGIGDVSIFIAPEFTGTKMKDILLTVKNNTEDRIHLYPLDVYCKEYLVTDTRRLFDLCTDIHAEIDYKGGKKVTKYIIHCSDNEIGYDIYFVFYNINLTSDAVDFLKSRMWTE